MSATRDDPGTFPPRARAAADRARRALGDRRAAVHYDWLRRLAGRSPGAVANALTELDELLPFEERIWARHREGGRSHYAQFRAPFELYALVRTLRPDHVIETGVSSGVSSAHVLLALRKNRHGTLHSIDLPLPQRGDTFVRGESPVALPPGRASGWAVPIELRTRWDLRIGSSSAILPVLVRELDSVGLFLHDSEHTPTHLRFELATVRPKLVPGSVVIADNTSWTGAAFPRFAREVGAPVHRRGRSDLVGLVMP